MQKENLESNKKSNINVNVFFDEGAESLNKVLEHLILINCDPLKNR